eukprot:13708755-Alexandrium_andersonii.AAC.1
MASGTAPRASRPSRPTCSWTPSRSGSPSACGRRSSGLLTSRRRLLAGSARGSRTRHHGPRLP